MREKKSIFEFLIITLVLSAIIDVIWIKGGESAAASGISALLMWCPAVAAFIVRARYYKKEKLFGWNKCKLPFILAAIFIPVIYLGLSYSIYWLASGSFTGKLSLLTEAALARSNSSSTAAVVITWIVIAVSSTIAAAGEEIGWRGFLLPQMMKIWSFKKSVIVSGLIWAVWHMPIILAGYYNPGTPMWYKLPMFVIDIMSFTVIISILRVKSKSIWPAVLLHASHNHFDQAIFGPMTESVNKAYFVGETGFITVAVVILAALGIIMFYRKSLSEDLLTVDSVRS